MALSGADVERHTFLELHGMHSRELLERVPAADAMYSLGCANPGAVTLHNSPRFMHRLMRTDGIAIDLGAVDIEACRMLDIDRLRTQYGRCRYQLKFGMPSKKRFGHRLILLRQQ